MDGVWVREIRATDRDCPVKAEELAGNYKRMNLWGALVKENSEKTARGTEAVAAD